LITVKEKKAGFFDWVKKNGGYLLVSAVFFLAELQFYDKGASHE